MLGSLKQQHVNRLFLLQLVIYYVKFHICCKNVFIIFVNISLYLVLPRLE